MNICSTALTEDIRVGKETTNRNIGCWSERPLTFETVKLHPKQEPFVQSCGFSLHVMSLENVNINTPKHEELSENALLKHHFDRRKTESPPTI